MSRVLTFRFLILFSIVFIGCGGNNTSVAPILNKTISGIVSDGLISGANVGIDTNKNGSLDSSEILTKTNSLGFYTFNVLKSSSGNILITSGIDTSINLAFKGILTANLPTFSTVQNITPLTTLLSFGKTSDSVRNMFGLTSGIDINSVHPIKNTTVFKAGVKLHTIASLIASATSSSFIDVYKQLSVMPSFDSPGISGVLTSLGVTNTSTLSLILFNFSEKIQSTTNAINLTNTQIALLNNNLSNNLKKWSNGNLTSAKLLALYVEGLDIYLNNPLLRGDSLTGVQNGAVHDFNKTFATDLPNGKFTMTIIDSSDNEFSLGDMSNFSDKSFFSNPGLLAGDKVRYDFHKEISAGVFSTERNGYFFGIQ
ncbi:MAG: hypothetical protein COB02_17670 [Candidatus Cloacimonadota bacterium]|nr:MAG: hypothetical protein COB02_17670 [Candidatus Cloacimonadota bacterium]